MADIFFISLKEEHHTFSKTPPPYFSFLPLSTHNQLGDILVSIMEYHLMIFWRMGEEGKMGGWGGHSIVGANNRIFRSLISVLYCKAFDKWLIQLLNGRMGNRWRKSTTNVLCLMLVVHHVSDQVVHSEFEQPGNCWKYDKFCLIRVLIYTLNKFGLVVLKFWCSVFFYLHKSKMAAIFTYQFMKNVI